MKIKKTKKKNIFYRIISILLFITSLIFLGILLYIDLLPTKYMMILSIILVLFNLLIIILMNHKRLKKKVKKIITVICILFIFIMSIGIFYLSRTLDVLVSNGDSKYKLENYSVLVLKDSPYQKLKDIKNKTVGYYENSTKNKTPLDHLNKKVSVDYKKYDSSNILVTDLLNSEVDAILIEDSIISILNEENSEFNNSVRVLYTFSIKVKVESTLKDVDVTKDSFAVYISGIDTYGEISSVSRSDVNIVMVVNPTTKQILLISIPRDYYVQLHGTTGPKDKLTHAGIYGVDMSIKTIEDLLDLEINYYLKVNFTSVIDIVDALDGLDVYSEYSFISYSGFSFKKGYNKVNGEQALDFARTRKAFSDGDRQRGKNQQAVIEAIIRKATNKSIITKYNSLLNAIDGKYQTNMSVKKITSLIKKQLNNMSSWTITSYSLSGKDSSNYTYTYNQLLYVMEPDFDSVTEAQELINNVLNNEKLESSYGEVDGSSNKVTKVPTQPTTQQTTPKEQDSNVKTDKEDKKIPDDIKEEENENNNDEKNELPSSPNKDDLEGSKNDNIADKSDSENEENDENENEERDKSDDKSLDDLLVPSPVA